MSGFSADWLALREPADADTRSAACAVIACTAISRSEGPLDVVDLGAGTGANLRYVAPRLSGAQRWRLVDDDLHVLSEAASAIGSWARAQGFAFAETERGVRVDGADFTCDAELVEADLGSGVDAELIPSGGLVTASALLDLVSADWLDALASRCAAADAAVLFALTYDGRMRCEPAEPGDERVRLLVNRHQRSDKGFGPALGPDAAARAAETFASHRYALRAESTDWRPGPDSRALQRALLDGWLAAAVELEPAERPALEDWHRRRRAHVEAGRSRIVVGHVDIAGRR